MFFLIKANLDDKWNVIVMRINGETMAYNTNNYHNAERDF